MVKAKNPSAQGQRTVPWMDELTPNSSGKYCALQLDLMFVRLLPVMFVCLLIGSRLITNFIIYFPQEEP
jgi:hypothetical protein